MKQGRNSDMTQERAIKLGEIGFAFEITPEHRKMLASNQDEEDSSPMLHTNGVESVANHHQQQTQYNRTTTPNYNSRATYRRAESFGNDEDLNDLPQPDFRF